MCLESEPTVGHDLFYKTIISLPTPFVTIMDVSVGSDLHCQRAGADLRGRVKVGHHDNVY
jgi:hypothetical protein